MLSESQRNFAHVTLLWNFGVIGRAHFKPGHFKFWSNFEFVWKILLVGQAPGLKSIYPCMLKHKKSQFLSHLFILLVLWWSQVLFWVLKFLNIFCLLNTCLYLWSFSTKYIWYVDLSRNGASAYCFACTMMVIRGIIICSNDGFKAVGIWGKFSYWSTVKSLI